MNSKVKSNIVLVLLLLIILSASPLFVEAQTVQFEMDIQPELSIEVLQNLNFGTVISESGTSRIELGNANMGIFEIRALAAQRALLTLDPPESLSTGQNTNGGEATIPIRIDAVYSDRSYTAGDLVPFVDNRAWITLQPDQPAENGETRWETGFVYVTGTIEVGDIPPGSYSGTLLLSVEYQ